MDFKDIAEMVGKIAPMLGTLLGGPAAVALNVGGMIASAIGCENTPSAITAAIQANPEAAVKIAEIESNERVRLQEMVTSTTLAEIGAIAQTSGAVNQTMQVEAAAERWPTYSWRPAIGFAVALDLVLSSLTVGTAFFGVMFFRRDPKILEHIPSMIMAMTALIGIATPILGIASYFRGKAQADPAIPAAIQIPSKQ